MLIYSKERLVPTDVNMMVLAGKDGDGYFYIHRMLYDQAVIIHDIYKDDVGMLIKNLTNQEESRADVERFMELTPAPISSLGPFLLLVKGELTEFEDMVGAIHVMSGPVNLRQILKYPFEMRNTPSFSLSIKEEYELAWDRFFKTTMVFGEQSMYTGPSAREEVEIKPMNGTDTVVEEDEDVGSDVQKPVTSQAELDALMAEIMAESAAILSGPDKEEEKEEEKPAAPAPGPEPEPEPVPETPKVKSGIDILKGGFL